MPYPQATRIIAIRHGETDWNVEARIQGSIDIGLNAKGRWQAQQVAQALADEELAALYTSDLQRASDTARALAVVRGCTPTLKVGLRERDLGLFEGRTFAEIEAEWPEKALRWRKRDPEFVPDGGESLLVFRARITATVHALAAQHAGQQIVLVSHGGVLDVLYRAATQQSLQAARTWQLGNAAINRLLWTPEGLSLVGWADSRHLEQHLEQQLEPAAGAPLDDGAA